MVADSPSQVLAHAHQDCRRKRRRNAERIAEFIRKPRRTRPKLVLRGRQYKPVSIKELRLDIPGQNGHVTKRYQELVLLKVMEQRSFRTWFPEWHFTSQPADPAKLRLHHSLAFVLSSSNVFGKNKPAVTTKGDVLFIATDTPPSYGQKKLLLQLLGFRGTLLELFKFVTDICSTKLHKRLWEVRWLVGAIVEDVHKAVLECRKETRTNLFCRPSVHKVAGFCTSLGGIVELARTISTVRFVCPCLPIQAIVEMADWPQIMARLGWPLHLLSDFQRKILDRVFVHAHHTGRHAEVLLEITLAQRKCYDPFDIGTSRTEYCLTWGGCSSREDCSCPGPGLPDSGTPGQACILFISDFPCCSRPRAANFNPQAAEQVARELWKFRRGELDVTEEMLRVRRPPEGRCNAYHTFGVSYREWVPKPEPSHITTYKSFQQFFVWRKFAYAVRSSEDTLLVVSHGIKIWSKLSINEEAAETLADFIMNSSYLNDGDISGALTDGFWRMDMLIGDQSAAVFSAIMLKKHRLFFAGGAPGICMLVKRETEEPKFGRGPVACLEYLWPDRYSSVHPSPPVRLDTVMERELLPGDEMLAFVPSMLWSKFQWDMGKATKMAMEGVKLEDICFELLGTYDVPKCFMALIQFPQLMSSSRQPFGRLRNVNIYF